LQNWQARMDHSAIYLLVGVVFGLAYRNQLPVLVAGLLLFRSSLELVRVWIWGEPALLSEFLVDSMAIMIGVGAIFVLEKWNSPRRSS
jgi:hypothetical protein